MERRRNKQPRRQKKSRRSSHEEETSQDIGGNVQDVVVYGRFAAVLVGVWFLRISILIVRIGVLGITTLKNHLVALITNVKSGKLRDGVSEGLVLCASNADHTAVQPLIVPEGAKIGECVKFSGHEAKLVAVLNPKMKQLDKITRINTVVGSLATRNISLDKTQES